MIDYKERFTSVLEAASGDIRRLSYTDRFQTIPVTLRENVAEHMYWVSIYSLMVHRALSDDESIIGAVLTYALTHDTVECRSGDLVRTFKYLTRELKDAVDSAEKLIEEKLPERVRAEMGVLGGLGESDRLYVKAVVKAADFMSLHQYMVREKARGNREINPFFARMQVDLKDMARDCMGKNDPKVCALAHLYELLSEVSEFAPYTV